MKVYKYIWTLLLIGLLCFSFISAFALDDDEPWEDETTETSRVTTTLTTTTTEPSTTIPYTSWLTTVTTDVSTTDEPSETPAPIVRISRMNLTKKPGAGEQFSITAMFQNYSNTSLLQGLAVIEPGEGLVLAEKSDSVVIPPIGPNGIAKVEVKLRALKDYTAADIPVTVGYTYSYRTPQGIMSASTSDKLMIPMLPPAQSSDSTKIANATPNIIVSKYNYGGTITAGDAFTLHLEFTNTSRKIKAENIVMAVETSDSITITSASNTYYYALLGAGKTAVQDIPMRVSASAGAQGAKAEITFRYEYVDNGARGNTSTSESLSIPIYIPDRFKLTEPDVELIGVQNEELAVSIPYVNKGKTDVSNVQAKLVYDENIAYCEQPHINLGNFEPGKSGTIDFYFTPLTAGSGSVKVIVSYEDDLLQEKTLTVTIPYSADEAMFEPEYDDPIMSDESSQSSPVKTILWIGVPVLILVIFVVGIVVHKKRKKKKVNASVTFDWGFSQPEEHSNENR